jgi:hypothetical protein
MVRRLVRWREGSMLVRALMAAQLVSFPAFAADDLPKELLLHCEGKMNADMPLP